METILSGVVGSTLYGLAHADSDVDRLAVHMGPIKDVLGFGLSKGQQTVVTTGPDSTSHEVAKYLRLVMKGNPTVTELLWLPHYETMTDEGELLWRNAVSFIGALPVRSSYGGYALQQIQRLLQRGDSFSSDTRNRKAKHARHCLRLLIQGEQLLREAWLTVELNESQKYEVWRASSLAEKGEHLELQHMFDYWMGRLDTAYLTTPLPEEPDYAVAEAVLLAIRRRQLESY